MCFARVLWEILMSVLSVAVGASILFCIPCTGSGLLRNEAASSAWSILPTQRKGRSPKVHCSMMDGTYSCSPLMMEGSSLHKGKALPSALWSVRVDPISSAVPHQSPPSPARTGLWTWRQLHGLMFSFFWQYLRFWDLSCLQMERCYWQIINGDAV